MLRQTKILATVGPATDSPEKLRALIEAGVNVLRINMSHAPHDWARRVAADARAAAESLGAPFAILVDLQGPAVRSGRIPDSHAPQFDLQPGDRVEFTMGGAAPSLPYSVSVNYDGLSGDIRAGDVVLVDNGVLHMRALEVSPDRILCEVLTGGPMGSRRHINLPGVLVNLPPLTEKDIADLAVAAEIGADFVAMSFVRDAAHIAELRRALDERGSRARIVAKIEDQQAVRNIDGIIEAADAVMVARGDLGIECHLEELPIIQRRIVKQCAVLGKPSIVATQMLESMIENPVPTRAEVTDAANAVYEETDAVMVSGETSVGKHPLRCIEVLDKIARRIEASGGVGYAALSRVATSRERLAEAAVKLANSTEGSQILVFTQSGATALALSHLRPDRAPIFAFTPDRDVCQSLMLCRSVYPIQMRFSADPTETADQALAELNRRGVAGPGAPSVIVMGVFDSCAAVDSILLRSTDF
ncbi:MAG: pyruvate kinase [Verrucomicrobiales bacterium]